MSKELREHYCKPERIKTENESIFIEWVDISFDGIVISEIFTREKFELLYKRLEKIYTKTPASKLDFERREINNLFNKKYTKASIYLQSLRKKYWFPWVVEFPLSKWIREIMINLHKISHDFIVIEFFIFVEENISSDLRKVMMNYHYPTFEENYNTPWYWSSHSIFSVEHTKKLEVDEYIESIKKEWMLNIIELLSLWEIFNRNWDEWHSSYKYLSIFSSKEYITQIMSNRRFLNTLGYTWIKDITTFNILDSYHLSEDNDKYVLLIDWSKFSNYKVDFSSFSILLDLNFYLVEIYTWVTFIWNEADKIIFDITTRKNINELKKYFYFLKMLIQKLNFSFYKKDSKNSSKTFQESYINSISTICQKNKEFIDDIESTIDWLFAIELETTNSRLQNTMKWLTLITAILAIIQIMLIEVWDKKYLYESILDKLY